MIGQVHIRYISTTWPTANSAGIQLLGLFPDSENTSEPSAFSVHSRAMFKAAVLLSHRYDIRIQGQHIQWQVAQTDGDIVNALDSMCQAVSTSTLAGIVDPAFSREAHNIAAFAGRVGIPVISYSATDPDLSDRITYPAFYRTVPSDNAAAIAIGQLFVRYNWTSSIIIHQNDAFGSGGAKVISKAFSDNRIAVRQTILFDVVTRTIRGDLKVLLASSSTRVVVLWADTLYTPSVIQSALDNDVLGPQFTWILSSSTPLTSFSHGSYPKLVGMLTVEPVTGSVIDAPVNRSLLNAAYNLWQQYGPETFPGAMKVDYYALFSFDATWSLIQSLQQICPSNSNVSSVCASMVGPSYCFDRRFINSSSLFDAVNNIGFVGVSGPIKFSANVADRINGTYYVVQNAQPSADGVNFTPVLKFVDSGDWKAYTMAYVIVWPGNSLAPPTDRPILEGITLRIALTESIPFTMLTYAVNEFGQNTTKFMGYVPDLIDLLQYNMKFVPQLILAPSGRTYNQIIQDVANGVYDMMMSDVTITAARKEIVSFSNAIFDNSLRIIMRQTRDDSIDFLAFLKTFSFGLWLTLLGSGLFAAILLCIIERQDNEILQNRSIISLLAMGMWYSLGVVVGYGVDFQVRTAAGRLLTVGLYIISIAFVATYTANLASLLTVSQSMDIISGIDDIKTGKIQFNRIGIRLGTSIEAYYLREISNGIKNYYPLTSRKQQYESLLNGIIDASFMDIGVAEYATNNIYCNLTLIGADFDKSAFGIVIPKRWIYAQNLDVNILLLRESGALDDLRTKWFQAKTCPDSSNGPTPIGVESLIGLFASFGIISILSVLLFFYKKRFMIKDYIMHIFHRRTAFTQTNTPRLSNALQPAADSPTSCSNSAYSIQL